MLVAVPVTRAARGDAMDTTGTDATCNVGVLARGVTRACVGVVLLPKPTGVAGIGDATRVISRLRSDDVRRCVCACDVVGIMTSNDVGAIRRGMGVSDPHSVAAVVSVVCRSCKNKGESLETNM